ncbi:hypothetical protein RYB04_27155, partial [Pseudomonas syringae pv. actinidiae]|nr:hypothetical protein [Pseudomonas syringae pv. actinidiae]MDU8570417.1 hypothetical protein [Pseudomonas syringae pv. actinidiae]MDU8582868.1 hypothetical protein [Pseudomonas syringae pv. actinidiae]MDU8588192.1 hypothetical protein [Pseudomonas syringae pv. actinidiae]MDU8599118.1 hypothetical protein [Pseudomonas syringae pv. actinidiae]
SCFFRKNRRGDNYPDTGGYAYIGLHMRRWFSLPRGKQIFNRCCAVLLSAAASMLLMARRA